jgi:endo-1,3-1,4-beta-glycanase ExoK
LPQGERRQNDKVDSMPHSLSRLQSTTSVRRAACLLAALGIIGGSVLAGGGTAAQTASQPSRDGTVSNAPDERGGSFYETFDDPGSDEWTSRWYVSDGWTNGDHQNCSWSSEQVSVENGVLTLGFAAEPSGERENTCGEIQTNARFGHGVYEVRMKAAEGSGLNTGFFTYIGDVHGQPHDEIDFEVLGKDVSKVQLNQYVDGDNVGDEKLVEVPGGASADFNDYAFIWEADRIAWYVNGELVHEATDPDKLPTHASKIYLSIWGSDTLTSWMGEFGPSSAPARAEFEHVAFTAPGADCQFPESIVCTLD